MTDGGDLGVVVGYAGTGKSAMLGVARGAWEEAGYSVRGVALSGIAVEGLEHGSGIASRTIASMEHGWAQGRNMLTSRDVLVIDEAGMVGTRQLERVLSHAAEAGAKVVLVGDPQQSRSQRVRPPTASEQLEALLGYPWPLPGRPPKHDLSTWTVTDDWPHPVPVTEAEIEVFERWFGDLFDELFGPGG